MSVVYVYHLTSGKEYPVTEKWYDSSSPCFSTDGKYLIFTSERDFNPIYSQTEWNHAYNRMGGVYIALLAKDTPSPFLPSDEKISIEDNASGNKAATKENKADNKAGQATGVTIDTEGLPGRLLKLPLAAGYYYQLYSDGKKVWYSNSGNTKVFDLAEQKEEIVAEGANMSVAEGNKKSHLLQRRRLVCM